MALGNALKYITKASTVVSSKSVSIFKQAQNFLKQTIDGENAIVSIFDNTGIAGFQFNVPQMEQVKLSNEIRFAISRKIFYELFNSLRR